MPTDNDDALNGAMAAPPYGAASGIDNLMAPRPSSVGGFADAAPSGSPRAVMFAWIALFAFLVFSHVITLKLQR